MHDFGTSGHRARFLIVTLPRSGSYHLASLLGSAPDVTCLGELYKPNAVELPPWLRQQVGFARHDTALRDADPLGYLALLMAHCDSPVFGFKEFLNRIHQTGIGKQTLRSRHWQKIFLFRNPIRKYLSLARAIQTGAYTKTEPGAAPEDNAVIRFDPQLFDETIRLDAQLRQRYRDLKAQHPRRNMALDYRELNDPARQAGMLDFIRAEAEPAQLTSIYHRQNSAPLEESIVDYEAMAAHARATGQGSALDDARHPDA